MSDHIIVILGPTATGKSDLAVKIAHRFNGEIISADSRQIYKGLDIGTGKITKDEMQGIKHYCIDLIEPFQRFTVVDWQTKAKQAINEIRNKGKLPIICGGTGFYIESIVNNTLFPELKSDQKKFEGLSKEQLLEELNKLDPESAKTVDKDNLRKVKRALELAQQYGHVPKLSKSKPLGRFILVGIQFPDRELRQRINDRLMKRMDQGMIEEAQGLTSGKILGKPLSYKKMDELGLEYRYLAQYLLGKLNKEQFINTLGTKIWQYARRQKTWWRRMNNIEWFGNPQVENNMNDIIDYIKDKLNE